MIDPLKPTPGELRRDRQLQGTVLGIVGLVIGLGILIAAGSVVLILRYWR